MVTQQCGDVWSDNSSLYFNFKDSFDIDYGKKVHDDTWNGALDRITGRLEVRSFVYTDENKQNKSWAKSDWALVCKKVDKLVDAK
jgi:hypothetical protein